jgi:hypothetical protein
VDQWQIVSAIFEDTPAPNANPSSVLLTRHLPFTTQLHRGSEIVVQDEDPPDKRRPLLGVKLTGYRLVNMSIVLAFGIWKAVLSYRGQSAAPTTLEFVAGTPLALM